MRKIEYALLQQKKQSQQQQAPQHHLQNSSGSLGNTANGQSLGAGQQKTTAVAQSISINNTQNNTIISGGHLPGNEHMQA